MSINLPMAGHADPTIDDPRRRRTILIAVCIALMAVTASVTGLNVAQPDLAIEFGASQSEVLWLINIYTMTLAALLLPLGALGDRRGRKPMLLIGLIIFGVANVTAGLATSTEMMLASRFLSGIGAAMIMPVIEHSFDTVGSVTSVIAVLALIYVLHEGPVTGWTEAATMIGLAGGLLAMIGFIMWELRHPAPLLDIRLFGKRGLASGSLVLLAVFGVQAGILVVLFPFLQAVLGWSALQATLGMMPMALVMMFSSGLAPKVSARIGSRRCPRPRWTAAELSARTASPSRPVSRSV
jgi:MFS family permease